MKAYRQHQSLHVLAAAISRVFDPVIIVPLTLIATISFAMANGFRWNFLALLFILDGVIPGLWVLHRFHRKKGKDWDIHRRQERIPLYIVTVISHGAGVMVAYLIDRHPLAEILLGLWFVAVAFWLITYRWKISVHAGVNAVMVMIITLITGTSYWWLWLILPLVGWARVVNKHHSLGQVVAGSIIPPAILTVVYRILGVI